MDMVLDVYPSPTAFDPIADLDPAAVTRVSRQDASPILPDFHTNDLIAIP